MKIAIRKPTLVALRSRGRILFRTSPLPQAAVSIWFWLMAAAQLLGQPVLTGVEVFTTDSSGTPIGGFVWNTVAGDSVPNAWVDTPAGQVNGPTDSLSPVMIVLPSSLGVGPEIGDYYFNIRNDFTINPSYLGVSLWFNSSASPQISVFGSTSGFGHSSRSGFSDTFTDGMWMVKIGSQHTGSLAWAAPGAPILDARFDVVGPFAVGSNGILDGNLLVRLDVVAEPSIFLVLTCGIFVLLGLRCLGARERRSSLMAKPNGPANGSQPFGLG